MELLESSAGTTTGTRYNPWLYVDFSAMSHISKELIMCCKEICAVSRADDDSLDVFVPEVKCVQSSVPAQPPRIACCEQNSIARICCVIDEDFEWYSKPLWCRYFERLKFYCC